LPLGNIPKFIIHFENTQKQIIFVLEGKLYYEGGIMHSDALTALKNKHSPSRVFNKIVLNRLN
jgi:hypothetical protein